MGFFGIFFSLSLSLSLSLLLSFFVAATVEQVEIKFKTWPEQKKITFGLGLNFNTLLFLCGHKLFMFYYELEKKSHVVGVVVQQIYYVTQYQRLRMGRKK